MSSNEAVAVIQFQPDCADAKNHATRLLFRVAIKKNSTVMTMAKLGLNTMYFILFLVYTNIITVAYLKLCRTKVVIKSVLANIHSENHSSCQS